MEHAPHRLRPPLAPLPREASDENCEDTPALWAERTHNTCAMEAKPFSFLLLLFFDYFPKAEGFLSKKIAQRREGADCQQEGGCSQPWVLLQSARCPPGSEGGPGRPCWGNGWQESAPGKEQRGGRNPENTRQSAGSVTPALAGVCWVWAHMGLSFTFSGKQPRQVRPDTEVLSRNARKRAHLPSLPEHRGPWRL